MSSLAHSGLTPSIPGEQASASVLAGDRQCEACLALNPIWFTNSPLWNRVKGGPRAAGDPGGVLCPLCFMARADHALGEQVWAVLPVNDRASNPVLDALQAARGYIGNPSRSGLPRDRQRDGLIDQIDAAILQARTTVEGPTVGRSEATAPNPSNGAADHEGAGT